MNDKKSLIIFFVKHKEEANFIRYDFISNDLSNQILSSFNVKVLFE